MSSQPQLNGEPAGEIPPVFPEFPVNNDRESIMANVRTNAARGLPILSQSTFTDTPVLMVAGGPSLKNHLDEIAQFRAAGAKIFAINGAYKFLVEKGFTPDYFFLIDSRSGNLVHVENPLPETLHILASQVHPMVYDHLERYRIRMVHLGTEATMEALGGKGTFLTAPIGFAGIHAIYAAATLGFKYQFLFGYDFSYEDSHHAFPQPLNDNDTTIEVTLGDKVYRTTDAMAEAAVHFQRSVSPLIRTCDINLLMFSEGLLFDVLKQSNSPENEQKKYEEMWQVPEYREHSPGAESIEETLQALRMPPGASVADFGCGTGRTVKYLQDKGFAAIGVDIAGNALEEDVPFVRAALWEADKLPTVEYGISTDVMEHIPPAKVRDVLQALFDSCSVGAYFNIDTFYDNFGTMIEKTLHLSVMPGKEWEGLLKEVWPSVEYLNPQDKRQAIFVCRR